MVKEFNLEKYFNCLLKIVPINIAALATMTIYRIFFFFYFVNFDSIKGLYGYVFKAFVLGLRFDLSVLAYVNSVVILIFTLMLFLRNLKLFKFLTGIIKLYYWLVFTALILLTLIDFGFFTYFGEHINVLIFQFFEDDTSALLKTIAKDGRFPFAVFAFVAASFIVYKLSSYTRKNLLNLKSLLASSYWSLPIKIFIVLLVPFMIFLAARGTVSMFPLGKFHTQISPNPFINNLSISSPHALRYALSARREQNDNKINLCEKFGIDKNSADTSIFEKLSAQNSAAEQIKPNVVFIILEGFGEAPILFNDKNFNVLGGLEKHFAQDTVLYNFLAAGRITIHCLESTVLNMPQRPFSVQITQSPSAYKQYSSAAALTYKKAGYQTKAVYGGSLAWRDIANFFKAQGFDSSYGEGDIENEHRHQWGMNDERFFKIVLRELKENSGKPKFIYALSTATHPPYEVPPYYKPQSVKIPQELKDMMPGEKKYGEKIFETYQFANYQAAKFIDEVKNSELAENTIIVITGDHNLREINPPLQKDLFKKYAVPVYIYMPKKLKKTFNADIAGCHMDIVPTLYDLSLSGVEYTAAGTSLLDSSSSHIAFNSDGFILSGNKAVLYDINTDDAKYFDFNTLDKTVSETEYTQEHEKMIEYYKKIMSASDIYLKSKKQGQSPKGE